MEGRLTAATDDPAPRVRESALRALAASHAAGGAAAAAKHLATDPWTFVRVAAAGAVAAAPLTDTSQRSLIAALGDPSPRVRGAAIEALATLGARGAGGSIGARAFAADEDTEVRRAAVKALGKLCAKETIDGLTRLAAAGASQVEGDDARSLSISAIDTLSQLGPGDLKARLTKALGDAPNDAVKRAATHALGVTGTCK
jgi:HEAT repeat protein